MNRPPDSVLGLSRRQLSFVPVFAQSVAAIAPAGTAAVTPGLVIATSAGGGALAAFAAATVVVLLVSACLRPMARRMASIGGIYSYTARALGPYVAIPTGWSAIIGYGAVGMAGLVAVGTYLTHMAVSLGAVDDSPTTVIVGLVVVASVVAVLVLIRGIRISAGVTLAVECVSLAIGVAIFVWLWTGARSSGPVEPVLTEWAGDNREFALSVVVAISAFVGFESSTTLSGEARRPFVSVPRTIRWTPVAAAVIYLAAVPVQALAVANAPPEVRESSTPLVGVLIHDGTPLLAAILDLGIAASFFACLLASVNALIRVVFCMAREGVAPRRLGTTHPRYRTPTVAAVAAMVVVGITPVAVLALGVAPDSALRAFLTLSACGYLGSYLAACVSAPALLRRIGESTPGVWVLSALSTLVLGSLVVYSIFSGLRAQNWLLAGYLAALVAAVVTTLVLRVRAPHRLAAVGIYDQTQDSDLLRAVTFR